MKPIDALEKNKNYKQLMKILKYIGISVYAGSLFAAAFYKNKQQICNNFETEMFKTSIEKKTVVTGKVIPEDEEKSHHKYKDYYGYCRGGDG